MSHFHSTWLNTDDNGTVNFVFMYLNLHLKVNLEVRKQGEEDSQWQLEDLRNRGDAIFRQCHAQILFDGVDEHLMSTKHRPSTLQHRQQQLQRDDLGPQLVGPAEERNCMSISYNASKRF